MLGFLLVALTGVFLLSLLHCTSSGRKNSRSETTLTNYESSAEGPSESIGQGVLQVVKIWISILVFTMLSLAIISIGRGEDAAGKAMNAGLATFGLWLIGAIIVFFRIVRHIPKIRINRGKLIVLVTAIMSGIVEILAACTIAAFFFHR